jgi:cytochrome c
MGEHHELAIHHRLGHHFLGFSCSYRSGQRRSGGCRHLIIRREPRRPAARFGREYPRANERMSASYAPPSVTTVKADTWIVPDIDAFPNNEWGKTVRFGRKLTVATYADLGPGVADPAKRFAGSNMSCQSCHLEAGTKKFGLPFVGVFADFPQYRSREGEVGTLEERINGCMTRSLNGRALPIRLR